MVKFSRHHRGGLPLALETGSDLNLDWFFVRFVFHWSFRRVSKWHLLDTGLQAIQLSPCRADLPARRS
jgi:hypothetical protein